MLKKSNLYHKSWSSQAIHYENLYVVHETTETDEHA